MDSQNMPASSSSQFKMIDGMDGSNRNIMMGGSNMSIKQSQSIKGKSLQ
jgi:hypothetical protein